MKELPLIVDNAKGKGMRRVNVGTRSQIKRLGTLKKSNWPKIWIMQKIRLVMMVFKR